MNSTVNKTFYTFYRIDVLKVRENFQERGKFPLSGGWEGGWVGMGVIRNFAGWRKGIFFTGGWEPQEEWFWWFQPFSKLKRAFCEYWTSIKIKVSMTCVSKEYEIKTKMVQKQWLQLKIMFYRVITWKFLFTRGNWLLEERK